MDTLAALASLAPYGIGPAIAGYGAYRGARSFGKAALRSLPPRKRLRVARPLRVKGVHLFRRSVTRTLDYKPLTGFFDGVNNGQGVTWTFAMSEVRGYLGASSAAFSVPNYTEFTNLFDAWRIKAVKVSVFFQDNASTTGSNTTNMPLMNYVWDVEDKNVEALTDIAQHSSVRRYQFGNGATRGGALVSYGKPRTQNSGVVSTSAIVGTKVNPRDTWIDTSSPGSEYLSFKCVMDPIGASLATSEGAFAFYFDITYECKDVI